MTLMTEQPTSTGPQSMPGSETDELPTEWEPVDQDELRPGEEAAWIHRVTGLRVDVHRTAVPTQMHTPETSRMDHGYTAHVRDEHYGGFLCRYLAQEDEAYDTVDRFMRAYPGGEFTVPAPGSDGTRRAIDPVDWEGQ